MAGLFVISPLKKKIPSCTTTIFRGELSNFGGVVTCFFGGSTEKFGANRASPGLNSFCGTVSGAPWTPENARGLGLNDQNARGGVVMNS